MSSFECPICLEFYNATANVPTSFPCGHSCCLRHTVEMMVCHVCRNKLPDKLTVNIGYRDGAIEFVAMMNRLARWEPRPTTAEVTASAPTQADLVPAPDETSVVGADGDLLIPDLATLSIGPAVGAALSPTILTEQSLPAQHSRDESPETLLVLSFGALPQCSESSVVAEVAPGGAMVFLDTSSTTADFAADHSETCTELDEHVKGPVNTDDVLVAEESTTVSSGRKKRKPKKKKASQPQQPAQPAYPAELAVYVELGILTPRAAALAPYSLEGSLRTIDLLPKYTADHLGNGQLQRYHPHYDYHHIWWIFGEVVADFDRTLDKLGNCNIRIADFDNLEITLSLQRNGSGPVFVDLHAIRPCMTIFAAQAVLRSVNGRGRVCCVMEHPAHFVLPLSVDEVHELLQNYNGQEEDGHSLCWTCSRRVNTGTFACKKCPKAKYCSKACQAADRVKHTRFCEGWRIMSAAVEAAEVQANAKRQSK